MQNLIEVVKVLPPDVQLVLALSIFAIVIAVASSSTAKSNFCDFLRALASLWTRERKPPEPPQIPPPSLEDAAKS